MRRMRNVPVFAHVGRVRPGIHILAYILYKQPPPNILARMVCLTRVFLKSKLIPCKLGCNLVWLDHLTAAPVCVGLFGGSKPVALEYIRELRQI